jgi:hypothetical protein
MITSVLIILIAIAGLIMIAGGIGGLFNLFNQTAWRRLPLGSYGMPIGMICGGLALWGIAQGLRIGLVLIVLENTHR